MYVVAKNNTCLLSRSFCRSGHGSDGPSIYSVARLQSRCHLDYAPIWRLNRGRNPFQAHSHSWQNSFRCSTKTEDPSFFLAVGWKLSTVPCHVGFSNMAADFIKLARSVSRLSLPARQSLYFVNRSQEGHCLTSTIVYC